MSAVMKAVPYVDDLYDQLEALPENLTGEIINGRLYTQPRPTTVHALAESGLAIDIGSAYHRGRGGPGGWWILVEPEIHFKGTGFAALCAGVGFRPVPALRS